MAAKPHPLIHQCPCEEGKRHLQGEPAQVHVSLTGWLSAWMRGGAAASSGSWLPKGDRAASTMEPAGIVNLFHFLLSIYDIL
jgi:hypothetical protein